MNICGFIFARGGSRGCPGKNIRPLGGKPLIGWAIERALASKYLERVIVSTDSPEIATAPRRYGADVPFLRPAELAGDQSPEWLAWRHAVEFYNRTSLLGPLDLFVSIPPVAPLRQTIDIDRCIEKALQEGDRPDVVFTVTDPESNPYFSMVCLDEHGNARLAATPPGGPVARRQDAPPVFTITPVCYAVKPTLILNGSSMFAGRIQTVHVPRERAIDIDTELDFEHAQFMFSRVQAIAA